LNRNVSLRESKQIIFIANLVVAGGVFFFLTQTLDAFNYPKVMIVSTGTFALVLALAISRGYLLRARELNFIEIWLIGMVSLVILLASANDISSLSTIWGSYSRANGVIAKTSVILLAAIYFRFSKKETISNFFAFALILLACEVIYGAIQLTGKDPVPWVNPYNNIFVSAGNPNFAAALFAILVVLNFRQIFFSRNSALRVLAFVTCCLGIYMSYATQSVQGILTIAAAVFLLSIVGILRYIRNKGLKLSLLSVSLAGATLISMGVFNLGPLKSFLFQETLSIRLHYWRVALKIIRDHPFFGVGIDQYGDYYRLYREPWFVEKYGPGLISTNAHNVGLQWGTDLGVLGILIYLSIFIIPTILYFRLSRFRGGSKFTDLDFMYISFFAFYLQSLISIAQLSVTILGFALLGMVLSHLHLEGQESVGSSNKGKSSSLKKERAASFVGLGTWWLILSLLLVSFTSYVVRKDLELRRALQLPGVSQQVSDLAPRSEAIKKAIPLFLGDQDYVSLAVQNLFSQGNAQTGVEIAKEATVKNPRSWVGYQSQVLAFAQSNQPVEALKAARKTIELDPLNYNIQLNLAEQAFKTGDRQLARKYAAMAKLEAPPQSEAYVGATKLLAELDQ
jgi:O-antigen ligase